MHISTHIDTEKQIRTHNVHGMLNVNELTRQLREIYSSPEYDPDMNVIWDLRKADFSAIEASEVTSFMEFVSKHWGQGGKSKGALVVSRDLDYGMSRMYEMLMEGATTSTITVFKNIDEAKKWLEE
jgi:hypothetical protein